MDKIKSKSEFLKQISELDRSSIQTILHSNSKPIKKLVVMSLIKNVGPQSFL